MNFDVSADKRVAPAGENIITAYAKNLAIVKGNGSKADKASAICWLFHLIGDVHQPLHVAAQYTDDYPDGDRGGNLVFVRAKAGGAILNLHSLWDGLLLGSGRLTDAKNVATMLRQRKDLAREKLEELSEADFQHWATVESFEIARRDVYLDGKPLGGPKRDDDTPAVPDGYLVNAKAIAERRIVLAGYRLADVLRKAVTR